MNFETDSILAELLVSAVGFIFFSYGRKMKRPPQTAGGLLLMIFPYFMSSGLGTLLMGAAITGLIYVAIRLRW